MIPFPDIDPIAFEFGPIIVRWYALAYLAGFLMGWQYCLYLAGKNPDKRPFKDDIDGFLTWAVLGVILGGRIGYVLFYNFSYYLDNTHEIFKIWHGGMSFHGGALGACIALILYARLLKFPVLQISDIFVCAVPIGLFFGRIANFINGELYGRMTDVAWAVDFPQGGGLPRHPSQLYEAILEGLVLFIVLTAFVHQQKYCEKSGFLTGCFLIGYGISRFVIEFFREPDVQVGLIFNMFSMGQVLCVPMILLGIWLIHRSHRVTKTS